MLTILRDPAGIAGADRFDLDPGLTLQQNIERRLPCGGGCALRINGVAVDPCTDTRLDAPARPDDVVTVVQRPEGLDPITWAYIALAALTVYTYVSLPKPPNVSGAEAGKDSPNNRLTAQTNVARAYQAVPDVYGYRRVWPDLIQASTVEYIDHLKYVTEWLCVSRGKGTLSAVQYAETPIGDISGASYEVFEPSGATYPEDGTTTLLDVIETFESPEVNGQEVVYPTENPTVSRTALLETSGTDFAFSLTVTDDTDLAGLKAAAGTGNCVVTFLSPVTGYDSSFFASETCSVMSYLVTGADVTFDFEAPATWDSTMSIAGRSVTLRVDGITPQVIGPFTLPVDADAIRWNVVFLRGLKGTVEIEAEWWQVDGDGVEIPGTREDQTDSYIGNTYDARYYTEQVVPAAGLGRYRIQFSRITQQIGEEGTEVAKLEELYAVRLYDEKELPGVTVIRVTTRATEAATGFSERKFNARWLRHVRELDSDVQGESRNFGRSMAHLWTISGNDIAELDTDKLAEINTALGEDSALLRFDGSLDDADMSLGERLQLMANHARCQVWRDGQRWTVTRDQARTAPEMQLDYRNLASGGESAISYASHLPASNDGIEIEYVDEDSQARKAYIRLSVETGAVIVATCANPKKLQLPACVTEAQALNRAHLEARRLLYQRTSVQDTALGDASDLGLGALVRWIDPNDFAGDDGLQAGEVLAVDGNLITTSEALDWRGETTGRVLLTGDDGLHLGAPVTCTRISARVVQLSTVPAGVYVADSTRQCGSRYAFAVGLTEAEVEAAGLYVVTEVVPGSDGACSLALVAYDARMYEAD